MKPTKEANALLKALSVRDDYVSIGRELAVFVDDEQNDNFVSLVEGYATVRNILED